MMTDGMREQLRSLPTEQEAAMRRKLGIEASGLSCLQVFDLFMADDEDDRAHFEARPAKPPAQR
jgi:hypothetical protein